MHLAVAQSLLILLLIAILAHSEPCSGDEGGSHSPVKTVDTKILAVYGEDFSDAFTLSNPNECRISEVHRTVGVLAHQLAYSRNVSEIERKELQHSSSQHFPKSFLGFRQVT